MSLTGRFCGRIAFICLAMLPLLARAQCDYSHWVSVWPGPYPTVIQPKQVFLFSGNALGGAQSLAARLQQFGSGIHVYLWSAHDSVDLVVLDRLVFTESADVESHTQVLLTPSRPLLGGTEYEMRAFQGHENLFYLFSPGRLAPGQKRATAYRWKTSSTPDTLAPRWVATPVVKEKKYEANSEGLDNYVLFSMPLRDSTRCLVKATVRHVQGGESVTTYIVPWQNQLGVGWFTCGGAVHFKSEEEYTVLFEAIDTAGNRASASGTPIRFRAPKRVACCWGN
ncbi:hypothetical protein [Hymenobacter properus]|uniref:Ig-like domain-containing protein n=1 Tax=Hymenobacter properus TaxID=2791026 RepID=A0A931BPM7_9BACT|nr:hypothetical protein [Hymenobacter properus]MBF9144183.1 hypothetical protein [Hymenobacter properus]MBR7723000.1 hypothetical protein [Microvirga sp. SRT04]